MYYNRIFRIWMLDPLDYFLISVLIASLAASYLKKYLSEKAAMERLKNSIINESSLLEQKPPILNSKESKIIKIPKSVLGSRGGQQVAADYVFSEQVFQIAQQIEKMVTRLAAFLKRKELKGILRIFFSQGRLILELILYRCNIQLEYVRPDGVSTQVIVVAITTGGATGFIFSWLSAGSVLVAPPLLASVLLLRGFTQQILHNMEYAKFKKMINQILEDDELKQTIQAHFMDGQGPVNKITMRSSDLDQNPARICEDGPHLTGEFNLESLDNIVPAETPSEKKFEEFVKQKVKEELGLVENPTEKQLEDIIQGKVKKKAKGKTVYFQDLVEKWADADAGIIDAEIVEEPIRVKSDDEL